MINKAVNEMVSFLTDEQDTLSEGILRATAGSVLSGVEGAAKEFAGWVRGVEEKAKLVKDTCDETIRWLKDAEKDNPNLELSMNAFYSWMKTSPTFVWRYYYILNNSVYSSIMKKATEGKSSEINSLVNAKFNDRTEASRLLDNAKSIKELIRIVETYRDRADKYFGVILKNKHSISGAPIQVALAGIIDLTATVKKIVRLAT